jgi:hypothetical protein
MSQSKTEKPQKHPGGRPRKYKSPDEMKIAIDKYFKQTDITPTKCGMALFLGFGDKQSLIDYEKRKEYSALLKNALTRLEKYWEERLKANNVTGAIFWLKNNAGYSDRQQIEHNGAITFAHVLGKLVKDSEGSDAAGGPEKS